jgi:putative salt-induced outer membrane protein YdiY
MLFCKITSVLIGALILVPALVSPIASQEWHPPEPIASEKDWVQLSSGEWLRGTIDLFRDLKLEFDSDDLDDLTIDWEDVAAFRSPRLLTFAFTGDRVATGTSSMRDGVIRISAKGGIEEFPRTELLSIIEGKPKEINYWSARASIGYTARAGNTDQQDLSTLVRIKREATRSRLNINYDGNFGEVDSVQTINNHRGVIDLNIFLSRRLYVTPVALDIYNDKFQNIDYRTTIGAGAGYYIFRKSRIDWDVGLGGGYQVTRYISVEAGTDQEEKNGAIIPSTKLEADVTDDIELVFEYSSMIGAKDSKTTNHHAMILMTIDFFRDIFELSFSFTWDHMQNPRANAEGYVPKRDDYRLNFGFAVDL